MLAFVDKYPKLKLIAPAILFTSCIALAFAAIYWRTENFRESQEKEFSLKALRVANSLEAQIFERYADSQAFALNPSLIAAVEHSTPITISKATEALNRFAALYKVYQALLLTDRNGTVVAVNSKTPDGSPLPRERWQGFTGANAQEWKSNSEKTLIHEVNDPGIRNRYFGGIPVHSYSSALLDKNGNTIGVITNYTNGLLLEREMYFILNKLRSTYGRPLKITLLEQDGKPLARFNESSVEYFPESSNLPSLNAFSEGVAYSEHSILAYAEINDARVVGFPKWKIILEDDKEVFLAEIRSLSVIANLLAGLVLLMLGSSVTAFFHLQARHRKEMLNNLLKAQEDERARISREIHDEIGQNLSAIKIHLQMLAASSERVEKVKEMLVETIESVRRVSHDLHPSVIENLGLEAAISWKLKAFSKDTGINTNLQIGDGTDLSNLPKPVTGHIYRIVLEAIHNAHKHAQASELNISITKQPTLLHFEIADNGVGISVGKSGAGIGLTSIRERTALCGGKTFVHSAPREGTRIICEIPLLS